MDHNSYESDHLYVSNFIFQNPQNTKTAPRVHASQPGIRYHVVRTNTIVKTENLSVPIFCILCGSEKKNIILKIKTAEKC